MATGLRRELSGVLLLDKPGGITSNQALQKVKRLFGARKAGHTGSLDPLATGMLPICFGEATKVSAYLLEADKQYRVTCHFGVKTDTADADGVVIETRDVIPTHKDLSDVLADFLGSSEQMPPMYSALKHKGQRLYALARKGIEVERTPRPININELQLLDYQNDVATLQVSCSKGTYVRALIEDIAQALGTVAHVTELRRLTVAGYQEQDMVTWETLEQMANTGSADLDSHLRSVDSALDHWPSVELSQDGAHYICQGQAVRVKERHQVGQVRLYGPELRFIGIGEVLDDGRVAPKRLMSMA